MFLFLLLIGLALLVLGADMLVRHGGQLALSLRVPALVVGLTVVAFGTSCPELAVSVAAAMQASTEMALANINGSNIANILLVLGAAAMVAPLQVDRQLIRREIPACLALQLSVPLVCWDGVISRWDGAFIMALGIGYNLLLVRAAIRGREVPPDAEIPEPEGSHWAVSFFLLGAGIAILIAGASLFINGATEFATRVGVSDRYIGLTVVALGTSAPELVTAMMSAYRGEVELAIGNSVGSNILNVAMVLGITSMIMPIELHDPAAWNDIWFAVFITVSLIPIVLAGKTVSRVEGAVAIAAYLGYCAFSA